MAPNKECKKIMLIYVTFDENSLELICNIGVDLIKIASFDIGNLPLIYRISKDICRDGGGQLDQIKSSVDVLKNIDELAILHCVSEYPCEYDQWV